MIITALIGENNLTDGDPKLRNYPASLEQRLCFTLLFVEALGDGVVYQIAPSVFIEKIQ